MLNHRIELIMERFEYRLTFIDEVESKLETDRASTVLLTETKETSSKSSQTNLLFPNLTGNVSFLEKL